MKKLETNKIGELWKRQFLQSSKPIMKTRGVQNRPGNPIFTDLVIKPDLTWLQNEFKIMQKINVEIKPDFKPTWNMWSEMDPMTRINRSNKNMC